LFPVAPVVARLFRRIYNMNNPFYRSIFYAREDMEKEIKTRRLNPEKAAARVAINGVILASLFVMLAVIFLEPEKFNFMAIAQMVLSIPFIFVSSLAYSKLGYWEETKIWDLFGYLTYSFGIFFMINAVGLIASSISLPLSFLYFGLIFFLLLAYTSINIFHGRSSRAQLLKFLFASVILFWGGIVPLLF